MSEIYTLYKWSIFWISVNILAFAMILTDKILSLHHGKSKSGPRIRELYLLLPVLLGSLPGTLIGMFCCNHKISKRKRNFQFKLVFFTILYCTISQKIFAQILGTAMLEEYKFRPFTTLHDLLSAFWSK